MLLILIGNVFSVLILFDNVLWNFQLFHDGGFQLIGSVIRHRLTKEAHHALLAPRGRWLNACGDIYPPASLVGKSQINFVAAHIINRRILPQRNIRYRHGMRRAAGDGHACAQSRAVQCGAYLAYAAAHHIDQLPGHIPQRHLIAIFNAALAHRFIKAEARIVFQNKAIDLGEGNGDVSVSDLGRCAVYGRRGHGQKRHALFCVRQGNFRFNADQGNIIPAAFSRCGAAQNFCFRGFLINRAPINRIGKGERFFGISRIKGCNRRILRGTIYIFCNDLQDIFDLSRRALGRFNIALIGFLRKPLRIGKILLITACMADGPGRLQQAIDLLIIDMDARRGVVNGRIDKTVAGNLQRPGVFPLLHAL